MIEPENILEYLYRETDFVDKDILVLLGPTASGKTRLAVQLAKDLDAEIISADSRQVYRHMNIGTGKDIEEYGDIGYHLIDIVEPGEQYNVTRFLDDFKQAYQAIITKGKRVIVCGGTGFYIQALLAPQPYNQIPTNMSWREKLEMRSKEEIKEILMRYTLPQGYAIDYSSKKRMIRALEILIWLSDPTHILPKAEPSYSATVIGLNPAVDTRRQRISARLYERIVQGMIEEVVQLIKGGITYSELEYYGLEYKYISYYLQGSLSLEAFMKKLETEIHRYSKRQMTYFRKMEKDGIVINWLTL